MGFISICLRSWSIGKSDAAHNEAGSAVLARSRPFRSASRRISKLNRLVFEVSIILHPTSCTAQPAFHSPIKRPATGFLPHLFAVSSSPLWGINFFLDTHNILYMGYRSYRAVFNPCNTGIVRLDSKTSIIFKIPLILLFWIVYSQKNKNIWISVLRNSF